MGCIDEENIAGTKGFRQVHWVDRFYVFSDDQVGQQRDVFAWIWINASVVTCEPAIDNCLSNDFGAIAAPNLQDTAGSPLSGQGI
jgi:hypothetical protein